LDYSDYSSLISECLLGHYTEHRDCMRLTPADWLQQLEDGSQWDSLAISYTLLPTVRHYRLLMGPWHGPRYLTKGCVRSLPTPVMAWTLNRASLSILINRETSVQRDWSGGDGQAAG